MANNALLNVYQVVYIKQCISKNVCQKVHIKYWCASSYFIEGLPTIPSIPHTRLFFVRWESIKACWSTYEGLIDGTKDIFKSFSGMVS